MAKDDIKQIILDEISKTEKSIKEYKDMVKPIAPDVAIGRISRMDAINNKSVMEASLRQVEQKLKTFGREILYPNGMTALEFATKLAADSDDSSDDELAPKVKASLLYTFDAADDLLLLDRGARRTLKP